MNLKTTLPTSTLPHSFFARETTTVARELLGKVLVYHSPGGIIRGIINETEAYTEDEASCHAYNGKTPRNEVMFGPAGHLYVYFTYGMHHCANIVTEEEGRGCAVLLRSIIPIDGQQLICQHRGSVKEKDLTNGPAKICQAMTWTKEHNGIDVCDNNALIFIESLGYQAQNIVTGTRVGISKAVELKWRFRGEEFV